VLHCKKKKINQKVTRPSLRISDQSTTDFVVRTKNMHLKSSTKQFIFLVSREKRAIQQQKNLAIEQNLCFLS